MAAFLEQLAGAMVAEHGRALEGVAVVLPSQRAGLYLRHALASSVGRTFWSPEMFTLASFMERLSGLRVLPMEELLFDAYESYREVAGEAVRGFDDFIQWAPIMLNDISETDAHMVPLAGFYRDLRSWEELDWSFNTTPLSDGQQRLVRYWAMTGRLHVALNQRLLAASTGTAGLVGRTAAENERTSFPWRCIWFAGLNAFTAAETRVIDRAREAGIARFAWDADRYYLDDPAQEAGEHLRTTSRRYGDGTVPVSQRPPSSVRVRAVRAPGQIAQAWCAADLVHHLTPHERERTAIVLADEGLLQPLLEALDGRSGPVNITMGLPLAQLPVGSLIEAFFRLWSNRTLNGGWLVADMDRALRHPYLRHPATTAVISDLLTDLLASGAMRASEERTRRSLGVLDEEWRAIIGGAMGMGGAYDPHTRLVKLMAWGQRAMAGDDLATQQIYQASLVMQRSQQLMERHAHMPDEQAWIPLITRLLRIARVGLFGEPLRGLQIMGLLESRALDHERCILLGAQEGKLPASSIDRSYIPFELRRAYGLPLRESADAVQAYNFMRLLQRPGEMTLVYAEDGTANGPSRYIAQLEHEFFKQDATGLEHRDVHIPVPLRRASTIGIANDDGTQAAIGELLARGLSPTMLSTWLRCRLDFWFKYVMRLKGTETPGARIPGNVLGEALHATMESIYRPWLGTPLSAAQLDDAASGFGALLQTRLLKVLPEEVLMTGQPLLQLGMATNAGRHFLRGELRSVERGSQIIPRQLELLRTMPLPNSRTPGGQVVMLTGRIDRVDERDGVMHILDLKTGRVNEAALRIPGVTFDALGTEKGYAAQLLMYTWFQMNSDPALSEVRAGLLPLQRALGSEGVYLRIDGGEMITRSALPAITEMLNEVVRQMMDPQQIFMHDPKSRYCAFCAS